MKPRARTLLVGLPSADWNLLLPLLDAGKLPHLAGLVKRGTIGKITGIHPRALPLAWTSVATGKHPYAHGILGDFEPDPKGRGVRPVSVLGRQGKALWNILAQNGHACQVVGWPVTHPAEPLPGGVAVSDRFAAWRPGSAPRDEWPLADGVVHPPELREALADLRKHPGEMTGVHLLPFVPQLAKMEHADHPLLRQLAAALAETASVQAAAEYGLSTVPWDFHAVRLPGLERISRAFINYHPPRPAFIDEAEFEMFRHVVEGACLFHDQLLGRLLDLAGEDTTVVLVSEQGIHQGELRSPETAGEPGAPPERDEVGMFVVAGPAFKEDHLVFGSSILDIAPTLLHHAGLAVGRDMDGKVLKDVFTTRWPVREIDSWDKVDGPDGRHPEGQRFDPFALTPAGPAPDSSKRAARAALTELRYHRAESLIAAHLEGEAVRELQAAWADDPDDSRYAYRLMVCYLALQRPDLAREVFGRMLKDKKRIARKALGEWQDLERRDPSTLSGSEARLKQKLWKQSRINLSGMAFLQAWLLHGEKRCAEALAAAESADEEKVYNRLGLIKLKADCLSQLERWEEAIAMFDRVLALDPDHADAHAGLARVLYKRERYEDAAAHAKASVGLRYFNPLGHYLYGASIYQCGKAPLAADALRVAVEQSPHLIGAYQRIILLHEGPLENPRLAATWRRRLERAEKDKARADERRRDGLQDLPPRHDPSHAPF